MYWWKLDTGWLNQVFILALYGPNLAKKGSQRIWILQRIFVCDFHPLKLTLLYTASQNEGLRRQKLSRELIFAEIFWTHCRSETKSKWYFSGGAIHHSMFCRLYHFMGNLPKKKILLKGHYEVIQRNVQQSVRSTSRFGKVATKKASLITYYYFLIL